jgi:FkbM family methyltransferase
MAANVSTQKSITTMRMLMDPKLRISSTFRARVRRTRERRAVTLPEDSVFGMKKKTIRFDDAVYFVPAYAAHRPVAQLILQERYESPWLHRLVKTVMTRRPGSMVHAGTFFGDMLPSFSRKTPGTVYAFEPVIENYIFSRAVVQENQLENVALLHAGLGEKHGIALIETMAGRRHRGGASTVVSDPNEPLQCPQRTPLLTIDQLDIEDLSLIQLDVEGFELSVLKGAADTIRAQQPVIVIEDDRNNCGGFLNELGYSEAARIGRDHLYLTETADAQLSDFVKRLPQPGAPVSKG